jgi:hypothetical protein
VAARRALLLLCLTTIVAGARSPARAEEVGAEKGVFGIGLIVGEPTGVSGKYYLGNDTAVDGAVGAAFLGRGVQAHVDLLWHPWVLDQKEAFALPVYLGGGLRLLNHNASGDDEDHVRIGLRVPVGILFDFTRIPLDVFAEIAGVLDYRTAGDASFGLDVNGGAGARYYF